MIDIDRSSAATIILSVELMMYGYLAIRISQVDNEIVVTWFGMADGGEIVANKQKKFVDLNWALFIDTICDIEIPAVEDYRLSIVWGVQLGNKEDELIYELQSGLWDRELMVRLVDIMEKFLMDEEPLEIFRNLLEWA